MSARVVSICLFFGSLLSLSSTKSAAFADEEREPPPSAALPPLATFVRAGRERALANREADLSVESDKATREAAVLDLLPSLSAVAGYTRNQTAVTLQLPNGAGGTRTITTTPLNQLDATFKAEATLLDVPAIYALKTADRRVDASRARASSTARDVERSIVGAYFDRVAAAEIERAADDALVASRKSRAVVAERRKADLASDTDLDRADAEIERRAQTVAEARLARKLAERQLRTLTGITANGDAPRLAVDLTPPPPLGSFESAVSSAPSVIAARAEVSAREASQTGALAALAPRVTAQMSERFTNAVGFSTSPFWSAGVSAEWRLDPSTFGASKRERAALESARVAKLRAEEDQSAEIEDAYEAVAARIARAKAASAQASASDHAAETARARRVAGTSTDLDVTIAERDAFEADLSLVQANAELARSRALLELASRPGVDR